MFPRKSLEASPWEADSGARSNFDKEFIQVMVADHQKDIAEFKKQAASGRGPAEQLAAQTLPTLEKHLRIAAPLKSDEKVGPDNSADVTPRLKSTGGSQPVTPMPERKQ